MKEIDNKKIWSILLIIFGMGFFFGHIDRLFRFFIQWKFGVNIDEFSHPQYDQWLANEPIVGAIFLIGGLILWYLPNYEHRN